MDIRLNYIDVCPDNIRNVSLSENRISPAELYGRYGRRDDGWRVFSNTHWLMVF